MGKKDKIHKIMHTFNIEIERDEYEDVDRRYWACCSELMGCHVHASSESEALTKINRAIGIWLDYANRSLGDDFRVEDYLT